MKTEEMNFVRNYPTSESLAAQVGQTGSRNCTARDPLQNAHTQYHTSPPLQYPPDWSPPPPAAPWFVCACGGKGINRRGFKGRIIKIAHSDACLEAQFAKLGRSHPVSFLPPPPVSMDPVGDERRAQQTRTLGCVHRLGPSHQQAKRGPKEGRREGDERCRIDSHKMREICHNIYDKKFC